VTGTLPVTRLSPVEEAEALISDRDYQRRWWTLAVLCLSLILTSVANTSLNVGLPTLARDLDASASQLQWIVDAYGLVFAGLLLAAGSMGDRYGRRAALNTGLVLFGISSALAAMSTSTTQLIAARTGMGMGAALVMPGTLSVLAHVFPRGERAKAVSIWAGFAGAGGASGTLTSGWLLQHFWWGSIFLSNVFVVMIALVAGFFLLPRTQRDHRTPFDPVGVLLSISALGMLVFAIIEAPERGWVSLETLLLLALDAVLFVAFIVWERRHHAPMLDMRLFKNARFTAATGTMTLIFFTMYGVVFLLTQYLQLVRGYSPLQAGLRVLPVPIVFMASAPLSASLVVRWGLRRVVVLGLLVLSTGIALLSLVSVWSSYPLLCAGLAIAAMGMGLTNAPSTSAIMTSLPLGKAGVGSAVNDTTRELGGALGVAVLGSLVVSRFKANLRPALRALPATSSDRAGSLSAALRTAERLRSEGGAALADAARHAYTQAFHVTLVVAATIVVLTAAVVNHVLRTKT